MEEKLKANPLENNFKSLCEQILKDDVGELDIFRNVINRYSGSLKIENDKITMIPTGDRTMEINVDRNDRKAFMDCFQRKIPYKPPEKTWFNKKGWHYT